MVQVPRLPTAFELPETDGQPVDNELQLLIPVLLRSILLGLWSDRWDWFFGVNLGLYYEVGKPAIGPDGFLSLGVPRYTREGGRLSYVLWEENGVVPQFALEIVSKSPGKEYDEKLRIYERLGVLHYAIYNPEFYLRDKHDPWEVYHLVDGVYVRQFSEPYWMPELGLGLGRVRLRREGLFREWLFWFDEQGQRYLSPEERIEQERREKEQEQREKELAQQQLERLTRYLQERGLNPDQPEE